MIRQLSPYLPYYPYLLGALFLIAFLLMLVAGYYLWRQRSAEVWRKRHDAGVVGGRLLFTSLTMMGIVSVVSVFSGVLIYSFDYVEAFFPPRNPYGVQGVALSSLPTPTDPEPTQPPFTPTHDRPTVPPVTATPTPNPLATLGITLPNADVAAAADANLSILTVSNLENDTLTPRTSRTLAWGTRDLFFWVEYTNVDEGVVWSPVLYYNGAPTQAWADTWTLDADGSQQFRFSNRGRFAPGRYEIRLYLAEALVDRYTFAIVDRDS